MSLCRIHVQTAGVILGMDSVNESRRYVPPLITWAHTLNDPCTTFNSIEDWIYMVRFYRYSQSHQMYTRRYLVCLIVAILTLIVRVIYLLMNISKGCFIDDVLQWRHMSAMSHKIPATRLSVTGQEQITHASSASLALCEGNQSVTGGLPSQKASDAHYNDVIMKAIASQITSLTIVYSSVYSGADQRKHQSSASLAFVWGIHRGPVNSPHKGPVTRKMFPFDDVIMKKKFFYVMTSWWGAIDATEVRVTVLCKSGRAIPQ